MQSSDTPDYSNVPDFSTAHSSEPNKSAQYLRLETTASKNLGDTENRLNDAEVVELAYLEVTVERGLRAFWEIGQALGQIRDRHLYRQGYRTFDDYCINRWEMSRRSAYQLIEAARVYENVRHGAHFLPANERQTRPLVTLPPEKQQEAWAKAVSTAPNGRVTSTHVAQIAKEYQQKDPGSKFKSKNISKRQQNQTGDKLISTGITPNQAGTDLRSCWNCYHCSREFLDDPHSFYCYQLGKLNFIEKDGNERGAECEFWTNRQAIPEQAKRTLPSTETFTLTLQLPAYLQPLIQDAARGEGLVLVDWVAKVLEAALKVSNYTSENSEKTEADGESRALTANFIEVLPLQAAQNYQKNSGSVKTLCQKSRG
ncbi:hypothetical protein IQ264_20690 [Phormidium sp. LEGE 05292]|uniref:hypothetical protein n=1 Tax=[Phormidium] sp. LEGE 05292 TaxID=767427 RepID=UPI00187EAB4D|nr:hypothetical protein [Phormidium sp. LEGE 05292]MBE9227843.1 hypothetical protein [Phormidium sp. LEGE 05292]